MKYTLKFFKARGKESITFLIIILQLGKNSIPLTLKLIFSSTPIYGDGELSVRRAFRHHVAVTRTIVATA